MAELQHDSRGQDSPKNDRRLTTEEFRAHLQEIGEERYHHRHPFHLLMHEGKLTRGQLQAWALNRYYYQSRIPMKDAIILSRSEDPEFRRGWRKRIVDHDGAAAGQGGIERWLRLAEATGLDREQVIRRVRLGLVYGHRRVQGGVETAGARRCG